LFCETPCGYSAPMPSTALRSMRLGQGSGRPPW
jgi:hypothetical protein